MVVLVAVVAVLTRLVVLFVVEKGVWASLVAMELARSTPSADRVTKGRDSVLSLDNEHSRFGLVEEL